MYTSKLEPESFSTIKYAIFEKFVLRAIIRSVKENHSLEISYEYVYTDQSVEFQIINVYYINLKIMVKFNLHFKVNLFFK